MRLPALHFLSAFDAVARLGSISKAATELHLTISAVSHRLSRLEEIVGVRLTRRTSDGVRLTADGRRYSLMVTSALANFKELSAFFSKDLQRMVVRIHTGPGFGRFWLLPRLSLFQRAHPEIDVELSSSFDPVDFDHNPIDLWVRRGDFAHPQFVVENIFTEEFFPLASPEYLKRHKIKKFHDVLSAPLIFCTRNRPAWPDWFHAKGVPAPKLNWKFAMSHAGYGLEAACQGLGLLLESQELAEVFLQDKRLVPVFPNDAGLVAPGHQLVYPAHHMEKPAVALFRKWLFAARDFTEENTPAH